MGRGSVEKDSVGIEQGEELRSRNGEPSHGTVQHPSFFVIGANRAIDFFEMGVQSLFVDGGRAGEQRFFDGPQRTVNLKTVRGTASAQLSRIAPGDRPVSYLPEAPPWGK